jgi:ferritin-like metal-binding protein YciE
LSNPRDAFFLELGELLWIERTLVFEVLPPAIEAVRDTELKEALSSHLEETRFHVARVESTFRAAGGEPTAARSGALAGLKADHESQDVREPTLRDLQTATASIRVEQLELAVYESVIGLARVLHVDTGLLDQNRKDEEQALKLLTKLADRLRDELPR